MLTQTMKPILFCVILAVVASAFATPVSVEEVTLPGREPKLDVLEDSRKLIENLIHDLRIAAKEAADAFRSFSDGLTNLGTQYRNKIINDIQILRERVSNAFKSLTGRFASTGSAVRNCIESRSIEASSIFNDTIENTLGCTSQRIEEVTGMLKNLNVIGSSASELASVAMRNMNECSQVASEGILAGTSCFGRIAVQTEMEATAFITQTGLEIARANMALATLPAALDVCAGSRMVEAGLTTARVVMEVGTCSASGIFSILKYPTL